MKNTERDIWIILLTFFAFITGIFSTSDIFRKVSTENEFVLGILINVLILPMLVAMISYLFWFIYKKFIDNN